jgi:hypothetical protein
MWQKKGNDTKGLTSSAVVRFFNFDDFNKRVLFNETAINHIVGAGSGLRGPFGMQQHL